MVPETIIQAYLQNVCAGFIVTKKGQCIMSGLVARTDHSLKGKGEGALTSMLERVPCQEMVGIKTHRQPGRQGTRTLIL